MICLPSFDLNADHYFGKTQGDIIYADQPVDGLVELTLQRLQDI